jgi:hypothetical protein
VKKPLSKVLMNDRIKQKMKKKINEPKNQKIEKLINNYRKSEVMNKKVKE